jgi:phage terminase small subunit
MEIPEKLSPEKTIVYKVLVNAMGNRIRTVDQFLLEQASSLICEIRNYENDITSEGSTYISSYGDKVLPNPKCTQLRESRHTLLSILEELKLTPASAVMKVEETDEYSFLDNEPVKEKTIKR